MGSQDYFLPVQFNDFTSWPGALSGQQLITLSPFCRWTLYILAQPQIRLAHFLPSLNSFWLNPVRGSGLTEAAGLTDHGGPSSQRCSGSLIKVISRCHASVGHLKPCVYIDTTRHQHAAVGVDGFHPTRDDKVLPNLSETQRFVENLAHVTLLLPFQSFRETVLTLIFSPLLLWLCFSWYFREALPYRVTDVKVLM